MRGDIAEAETAQRVVEQALDRFGRIDSLVNNAGIFIGKPFTDYTPRRLRRDHRGEPGRASSTSPSSRSGRWSTQGGGHVVNITASLVDHADSTSPVGARIADQGRPRRRDALAGHRVRVARRARQRGRARGHRDPGARRRLLRGMAALHPLGRLGEVSDVVDGILYLEGATFVTGETLHIDGGQAAGH